MWWVWCRGLWWHYISQKDPKSGQLRWKAKPQTPVRVRMPCLQHALIFRSKHEKHVNLQRVRHWKVNENDRFVVRLQQAVPISLWLVSKLNLLLFFREWLHILDQIWRGEYVFLLRYRWVPFQTIRVSCKPEPLPEEPLIESRERQLEHRPKLRSTKHCDWH